MFQRIVLMIGGVVFGIVAIMHLLRIIYSISIIIAGYTMPLWASWAGLFVALILSILMFKASSDKS